MTPSQLRSHARFGTPLSKEALLELANQLEELQKCTAKRRHNFVNPVPVALHEKGKVAAVMAVCEWCKQPQVRHYDK